MKLFSYFLSCIFLVIGLACNDDDTPDNLMRAREVAWNNIDEETKATITTKWREAHVEVGEETYLVLFNTKVNAILGPVGVYVNRSTFEIEGFTPRF